MEFVQNKAVLLNLKKPERVTGLIPKSEEVYQNQVLVNWGVEETRVLNNLGIKVPSPISRRYQWPGQYSPFAHQKKIAEFLSVRPRAFNFSEQGTGKTASAAWAADYLMREGIIKRVLILCPVSIMESAWRADLFKTLMHRTVDVAYGTAEKRKKIVQGEAEFIIVNYDGLRIIEDEVRAGGFDLIIVDEANAYKNPNTARWKCLKRCMKPDTWLWMMTGTPAAQSPEDAYGLAKLVSPDRVPHTKGGFKNKTMYKITTFKWLPKPNATEIVHDALQPAIRFTKDQCLDLPPMVYAQRDVEMSPQQRKYYKKMKNNMVIVSDGEEVTAANAAVNLSKLLQISSGGVLTDTKEVLEFDISKRMAALKEVIDESNKKVLIFAQYTHVIEHLHESLTAEGFKSAIINGAVKPGKRTEIFDKFQTTDEIEILVIQPQAAAHGVTLTAADTVVWWGPTSSLEIYEQANARIHRAGQDHKCTVVQLQASAAERHIYRMLDQRINIHGAIMDLYKIVLAESDNLS